MGYKNRGIADRGVLSRIEPNDLDSYEAAFIKIKSHQKELEKQNRDTSVLKRKYSILVRKAQKSGDESIRKLLKKYPWDGGIEKE